MVPVLDCEGDILAKAAELTEILKLDGFVYLKNCGLDWHLISNCFSLGNTLWSLSNEQKTACSFDYSNEEVNGYIPPMMECLNPDKPENHTTEIREAYNFTLTETNSKSPPIHGFDDTMKALFNSLVPVSNNILTAMAIGLEYDSEQFSKTHTFGRNRNPSTIRLLNYPVVDENTDVGAERCGEHSDYGSITLLFQDNIGGLQVKQRDGNFVDVNFEPEAVLVNTGDVVQRWTSNQIIAVKHRIVVTSLEISRKVPRRSIAFFTVPNYDTLIAPLDGSDLYPKMTQKEHLDYMFKKTVK